MIKFEKIRQSILSEMPAAQKMLLDDPNIIFAYLFGGLAKGIVRPLSDVDIAVYVKNKNNLAEYKLELFYKLADILKTAEQDIIILNDASINIAGRIVKNKQILIDKSPSIRHVYESVILREFFDFQVKEKALLFRRYGIA